MPKPQSPYLEFDRAVWKQFRQETPMTLSENDLLKLQGQLEPVSATDVMEIYLPMSRLLNLYVAATQQLYNVTGKFLGHAAPKVPYIIGVAGSVGVGKSTTSRILKALLSRWEDHPRVELITTDGYLYNNATLEQRNLMQRKGFPESYDLHSLIEFLSDLKSGKRELKVPLYSHYSYDVLPEQYQIVDQPDIVIVEGLNVLQGGILKTGVPPTVFVSDFFDFTIYVDAKIETIKKWFLQRFRLFRSRAADDKDAFFYRFAQLSEQEAVAFAEQVWIEINEANLLENILPFKERAKLILVKKADHAVGKVFLRKI